MTVLPIVYVKDVEAHAKFYSALGGVEVARSRTGDWVELRFGQGLLALHRTRRDLPPCEKVELSFIAGAPLEEMVAALQQAGLELYWEITDEAFGRVIKVKDPEGMVIQINEHEPELYQ
jgi:predicted enzyme related to lactoylglutathione lyase